MTLASNTIVVAPRIKAGSIQTFALSGSSFKDGDDLPVVNFHLDGADEPDTAIKVKTVELQNVTYAVPGNSEPGPQQLLKLEVSVGKGAKPGQRNISVRNAGAPPAGQAPFFLWVEPS